MCDSILSQKQDHKKTHNGTQCKLVEKTATKPEPIKNAAQLNTVRYSVVNKQNVFTIV